MTRQVINGRKTTFDGPSNAFFRQDPEKLQVLAHPLRLKLLKLAAFAEVSAKEASAEMREPIGKVSYHVRVLADAGLLELVRQTPRRGAIESHYRATVLLDLDDDTWDSLTTTTRSMLMVATIQERAADMVNAAQDGGFEVDGACVANCHFLADEQGLDDLRSAIDDHYERLLAIEAGIAERLRENPGAQVTAVNAGMTLFGGERTPSANGPLYFRQDCRWMPLIPED